MEGTWFVPGRKLKKTTGTLRVEEYPVQSVGIGNSLALLLMIGR